MNCGVASTPFLMVSSSTIRPTANQSADFRRYRGEGRKRIRIGLVWMIIRDELRVTNKKTDLFKRVSVCQSVRHSNCDVICVCILIGGEV